MLATQFNSAVNAHNSASTNHFEIVEFLFDLLGKQRRQSVARSDVRSSIILAAGPCFEKLNPRTEDNILDNGLRTNRGAPSLLA